LGVGTKLKVAQLAGRHDTIGEDLVNHCVNDIAVQGARPLFFLDYFAVGTLDAQVCSSVVSGLARGCKRSGCALIGGETAEMPGFYQPGEYDVAGFIVGAAERSRLLTGDGTKAGDVLLGLPSTGLHTNGYSLARRIFFTDLKVDSVIPELGLTVADELLNRRVTQGPPQLLETPTRAPSRTAHPRSRPHHRRRHDRQYSTRVTQRPRC